MGNPKKTSYWKFLLRHPIPIAALAGLAAGFIVRYEVGRETADFIWLGFLAVCGAPLVWKTSKAMLRGNFAQDVVAMLAVVTAVLTREYFAGLVIVIMQTGGEALEDFSLARASSSLDALLARAPRTAFRKIGENLTETPVEDVQVGEVLTVRPGDLIPVDGSLLSNFAQVDESALTGEPLAPSKQKSERLLSGSVNIGGPFDMVAERRSEDSQYSRIVQLVKRAQEERPPLQRLADRYAVWFTPLTLAMCAVGWALTHNFATVLAVLVVATPCPLILAVPVAVISAINRAAAEGIITKGGAAMEHIGRAKVVVFDKTGTLTTGTPQLSEVVALNHMDSDEVLRLAASAEQLSTHALAREATLAGIKRLGSLELPSEFKETPGRGVQARVQGKKVLVGSRHLIEEELPKHGTLLEGVDGALEAYVAIDDRVRGLLRFRDTVRAGAVEMVPRLKSMGVAKIVMLTGDNEQNARHVGEVLGIEDVRANLLPEEKVQAVRELGKGGAVTVMVGDGINDAPALATATVGVAMGAHGTGISAEAAQMVLLVDEISKVADAVSIGKRMLRVAKQSIYAGIGVSFILMVVAVFGKIVPVTGALLQEALDVAVILNALRARRA